VHSREFNREFFDFRPFFAILARISAQFQWLAAKFPTKRNGEFFSPNREFFGANREFQGKVASTTNIRPRDAAAPLADMKRAAASTVARNNRPGGDSAAGAILDSPAADAEIRSAES
jgi:hypothetical protein